MLVWPRVSSLDLAPGQICFKALMASRCCCFKPGLGLFALMLLILKGLFVKVDRASAVRKREPPPSPWLPFRVIIFLFCLFFDYFILRKAQAKLSYPCIKI